MKRKRSHGNAVDALTLSDQPDPGKIKLRSYASISLDEAVKLCSIRSESSRLIVSRYEECPIAHVDRLKLKSLLQPYPRGIGDEKETPEQVKVESNEIISRILKSFTKVTDVSIEFTPKQLSVNFSVPLIWKADLEAFGENLDGTIHPVDNLLVVEIKLPSNYDDFASVTNVNT